MKGAWADGEGPGWFWQLLEFFGMTWPGRAREQEVARAPICTACGNPARRDGDAWRCPHHPTAELREAA